jgi:UDP-N-acetylmuramoyl-L-alanyl-D-glutamate--2,6-diaminopimelate ligase
VVIAEEDVHPAEGVPVVRVVDARQALAEASAALENHPSQSMSVVGITGTNGKTTTSWILESILSAAGRRVGLIGTTGHRSNKTSIPALYTTPPAPQWQGLLRRMKEDGCEFVATEVSSIALDSLRVHATRFEVAVFTNLSRDHLDYHGSMEAYGAAKKRLFEVYLRQGGHAVVPESCPLLEDVLSLRDDLRVWRYGLMGGDVFPRDLVMNAKGSSARVQTPSGPLLFELPLIGEHNVKNGLAAVSIALSLGLSVDSIERGLSQTPVIPGRMEAVESSNGPTVLVDYAHTPDALQNAIQGLKPLVQGELKVVFGCGGDRDPGKRSEMGRVACEEADWVWVTSDNPRSENPTDIINDIAVGLARNASIEEDRAKAIEKCLTTATSQDVVLIAGKGHEQYQEIQGVRHDFDDRVEARRVLEGIL